MATNKEAIESAKARARAAREEYQNAHKALSAARKDNRELAEVAQQAGSRLKRAIRGAAERDSVERTLIVSLASNIGATVLFAGGNAAVNAIAKKSAWLATGSKASYAKCIPPLLLGYGGAVTELATRPAGLVDMGREIAYRLGESYGTFGLFQLGNAVYEGYQRDRQQLANAQQVLSQPAAP